MPINNLLEAINSLKLRKYTSGIMAGGLALSLDDGTKNMVHRITRLAAGIILSIMTACPTAAHGRVISREAEEALAAILPAGYRAAAVVPYPLEKKDKSRFVVPLVDVNDDVREKGVRLLYLAWNRTWSIVDAIEITSADGKTTPQYVNGIAIVKIGTTDMLYVYTNYFGGGSGSSHYFDFYRVEGGRLKRIRSFEHDRMERGLLCLRNNRIYDAIIACDRIEKKGRAYIYGCFLDTTEYTFDRQQIVPLRKERVEKRRGNRYLCETYWNMSLRSFLRSGSYFPPQK